MADGFEQQRAELNAYFCNNVESSEQKDAGRFEVRYREYRNATLDEIQVYEDVRAFEEQRRINGKPPKVRFFTQDEQREWERQQHQPPAAIERERP